MMQAPQKRTGDYRDWSQIKGFNYQPSWWHSWDAFRSCMPSAKSGFWRQAIVREAAGTNVAFARSVGKPLIASECCWGNVQDQPRVEGIRYTLGELQKRGIAWTAYLMHHSLIADAHRMEFGPMGAPGNLSFIEADGSLRPGHEVFNEFCQPT